MRKKIQFPLLLLFLLLAPTAAISFSGPGDSAGGPGHRDGMRSAGHPERHGERHLERLAARLGLSEEQRTKVAAILADEKEKARPLREQMAADRERLQSAIHSGAADETTIRTLAGEQEQFRADLLVLRAQTWRQINGLLTPEQQELAKSSPLDCSPEHGRRGPGNENGGGWRD